MQDLEAPLSQAPTRDLSSVGQLLRRRQVIGKNAIAPSSHAQVIDDDVPAHHNLGPPRKSNVVVSEATTSSGRPDLRRGQEFTLPKSLQLLRCAGPYTMLESDSCLRRARRAKLRGRPDVDHSCQVAARKATLRKVKQRPTGMVPSAVPILSIRSRPEGLVSNLSKVLFSLTHAPRSKIPDPCTVIHVATTNSQTSGICACLRCAQCVARALL